MATQHIEITGTASRLSADLRQLIDAMRRVQNNANSVKAIIDQVKGPDPADWQAVADKLGVPLGKADTVYNLLDLFTQKVNGVAAIQNFIDRLG